MEAVYRIELVVPATVVDGNRHVNNVVYVQWMQEIAMGHSEAVGCTAATQQVGATWVARSHYIEYLKPAFAGDHLQLQTWVSDFRRVRSLRKYRVIRPADQAVLARGETDWVFVDEVSGRPRAIPESVSGLFKLLGETEEPAG